MNEDMHRALNTEHRTHTVDRIRSSVPPTSTCATVFCVQRPYRIFEKDHLDEDKTRFRDRTRTTGWLPLEYEHINMIWAGPGMMKEGGVLLFVCSYAHRSLESGTLFPTLKPSRSTHTHVFCVRSPYQIFEEDHSVLPSDHTGHTITTDSFWSLSCLSPARGGRTKT
jgi:hypothetical protein